MIPFFAIVGILILAGVIQYYGSQRKERASYKHFEQDEQKTSF
ncbi:hypothetical protein [Liquorilactobacillus satsumensis]|nr:hypothetical protein [Liquorilactobacillus satsumensis]